MRTLYTDYPIYQLGDIENERAPIREAKFLWYDGDKYCTVEVEGEVVSFKRYYLYNRPCRPYDRDLDSHLELLDKDLLSHSAVCRLQRRAKRERYRIDKKITAFRKSFNEAIDKKLGTDYKGMKAYW